MFFHNVEIIFQRVGQRIPEVQTGFASGLPYVAICTNISDVGDVLQATESLLAALYSAGVSSPIMLDVKNDFVVVRFACTRKQMKVIQKVLKLP